MQSVPAILWQVGQITSKKAVKSDAKSKAHVEDRTAVAKFRPEVGSKSAKIAADTPEGFNSITVSNVSIHRTSSNNHQLSHPYASCALILLLLDVGFIKWRSVLLVIQ